MHCTISAPDHTHARMLTAPTHRLTQVFYQVYVFAPRHVSLSLLLPQLELALASPHLALRRAAVNILRQVVQRQGWAWGYPPLSYPPLSINHHQLTNPVRPPHSRRRACTWCQYGARAAENA